MKVVNNTVEPDFVPLSINIVIESEAELLQFMGMICHSDYKREQLISEGINNILEYNTLSGKFCLNNVKNVKSSFTSDIYNILSEHAQKEAILVNG
jgi:hypothetical protein